MQKVPKAKAGKALRNSGRTLNAHVGEQSKGRRSQRSDILEAAVDLFAKGGSRGTPMAAIAERIGVSIPAITHHFGSKHGLFMEVIAVSDSIDEVRTTPLSTQQGIDRLSAIRFWARTLTSDTALANLSRLTLVMTAEALDADFTAHEHFVERHRRFRQLIAQSLASGQRDGSITKTIDPDNLAIEIIAFVQGSVLQWHLDPEVIDLVLIFDNYFDRLIQYLSNGVVAPATPPSRPRKKPTKKTAASTRATKRTASRS